MFIFSEIIKLEEDVVLLEPPGVGGGTTSAIKLLGFCKPVLMIASYLRYGLICRAVEDRVWYS